MNKRARLNYINALSQNVEHKKMYKAKKQWVVAGISFLVATGMGAIGSHLTTHADTTNNQPQTTSIEKQAGKLANSVKQNAAQHQMASSYNPMNETQSAQPSKASATPASSKVSGNKSSSVDAKSSVTSNVATSGNSKSNNRPQIKMALGAMPKTQSPQYSNHGTWGTGNTAAKWELSNTGNLNIHDGTIINNVRTNNTYTFPDGHPENNFGGVANNVQGLDFSKVKSITTSNVTVPSDISDLFEGISTNLTTIDLSGIKTRPFTSFNNVFAGEPSLTTIIGMQQIGNGASTVDNMDGMFNSDRSLKSVDLSHFNTVRAGELHGFFGNDFNLQTANLGGAFTVAPGTDMDQIFNNDNNLTHLITNNKVNFPNVPKNDKSDTYTWGYNNQTGNIQYLFDGHAHPGDWTLINTGSPSHWGTADWIIDKIGNVHVSGGQISRNLHDAQNLDWSKVNKVYFTNVSMKDDSNPQIFNSNLNELLTAKHNDDNNATSVNKINTPNTWSDVSIINTDKNIVNNADNNLNGYYDNLTDSDIEDANNDASAASSATENAGVENLVASLDAKDSSANATVSYNDSISASDAEKSASESASSNADSFASALSEALTGQSNYSTNGLTKSESSAVTDAYNDYQKWSGASTSAQNGSTQASTTSIFVSDLGNVLSGSSYSHNSLLNVQENSIISSVATDYSNWNAGSNKATTDNTSLSNLFNSNSSASSTIAAVANSVASSYAQSLTASSSNSTTTISGIASSVASGLISSLFNSSNSNGSYSTNTIDSVASFFASSLSGTLSGIYAKSASVANYSTAINNLKANTAITFTFKGANSDTIPATMTNGYIKANGKQIDNSNTYDVTNLLNEELASKSKHVVGTYTITLGTDTNGYATASFSSSNNRPQNKVARLLGTEAKIPASTDTAHNVVIANNQAEYKGTITLNFGSGSDGSSTSLSFDTGSSNSNALASDSINLLNYAKSANNSISSDFTKDGLFGSNFDTTGFTFSGASASENGKAVRSANPYNFIIQPSDATNQSSTDVHSNYNITLNYTAQPVTEKIQYVYKNSAGSLMPEGLTSATSNDDIKSNWNSVTSLNSGWALASSGSNANSFSFTNSGTYQVSVAPSQTTDTINYVDQKGNNVGSQTFTGNNYQATDAGNNSVDVTKDNDTSLDKNYKLKNADNSFKYNGGTYTVSVIGNARSPENTIPSGTKPSDANNPKSNKSMNKPSNDSDVLFTINVQDYNADGTKEINHYTKYATESGEVGDSFAIKASDYLTNGFTINTKKSADNTVNGTIGDNQLQPNCVTFDYYAKASSFDPNKAKTDPNYVKNYNANPTTPKPITVQYIGELNGKTNQVVKTYSDVIIGNTGDTGNISNIESKASVPTGYTVNGSKYDYTITTNPQTIKVNLNSKTAKQMNNGGQNYKPTTPSDKPSSKVPSDSIIKEDASHGFATVIINENINGKLAHQSAQTVDESNLGVGTGYTIEPTSFTPTGYQVDSNDKALTGTINPDGSLSNSSATFTYDVNDSEIAPITITYYNQYGDLVDVNSGKSKLTGEDVTPKQATVTIQSSQLATKGAIGDYVDITGFLTAPKGHHFNKTILDSSNNNLDHVQLQKANNGKPSVHLNLALFENEPTPNSNSTKPSSSTAQVSMSSDQLASLASEIGSNITIKPNISETDEVVDNSALTSLASEVATNNQEISNLANKPTSAAGISINYDYFNNLINNGVSKLTNAINRDFKSNIKHVHAQSVKPRRTVGKIGKRTYSYLKWLRVVKPLKLYNNSHEAVRTIKPRHRITLNVKAAYKVHNHIVFKVSYKQHNYFIKANNKVIKNAYLPASYKLVGRKVRVLFNVYANRRKANGRVKTLHKGYKSTIKHIVRIGSHNVTRIQLSNGLWISANMNYVKVL